MQSLHFAEVYADVFGSLGWLGGEALALPSDDGMVAARAAGLSVSDVRPFYSSDSANW